MRWSAAAIVALLIVVSTGSQADTLQHPAPLSPTLQARLASVSGNNLLDVIIDFQSRAALEQADLAPSGVQVFATLASVPSVLAWVPAQELVRVQSTPGVTLVENNDPIEYDLDTAVRAANALPLWGVEHPRITLNGTVIDGSGVTVAIVDTGVDSQHDDLRVGTKVVRNIMALGIPATTDTSDPFTGGPGGVLAWRDTDDSDGDGHGSHVAGIVAGQGGLSGGKYKGSAPGAKLVAIGSPANTFWYAAAAWDWIYQNHASVQPPIRIVTNSWGYGTGPCDLGITLTKIERKLILEKGITMFFSAGNSGGDGQKDSTRNMFKCPWEGAIGVANYDDQNTGTRDYHLSRTSSRGSKTDMATWPDIAAPGANITSTNGHTPASATGSYLVGCQLSRAANLGPNGCYTTLSGTSMATPFAAGVGALLLQARPDLKPADVEFILEQTAYKFDGAHDSYTSGLADYRHNGSHYARGHGLVDAEAAVAYALRYDASHSPVVYGEAEIPVRMLPQAGGDEPANKAPAAGLLVVALVLLGVGWRRRGH